MKLLAASNLISCLNPQQYHDCLAITLQFHPTRQRTPPSWLTLVSVGFGSSLLCNPSIIILLLVFLLFDLLELYTQNEHGAIIL